MLILFLDDQDERHKLVDKYLGKDHTILHCYNAEDAIKTIQNTKIRIGLAMLDHDLMDFAEENGFKYEKHGVWFLHFMFNSMSKEKFPVNFLMHSYNPDGAKNMVRLLEDYDITGRIFPFSGQMLGTLQKELTPQ